MPRLKSFTDREVSSAIQMFGWYPVPSGNHPNYRNDELNKKIQIPYTGKAGVPPGTLRSIFREASMLWVLDKMREGQSLKEIRKNWSGSLLQP